MATAAQAKITGQEKMTEQPNSDIREIERQIAELLERVPDSPGSHEELERLRSQLESLRKKSIAETNPAWERVLLARHPQRPYTLDYVEMLFTDFTELRGDRHFADDQAIICGLAQV